MSKILYSSPAVIGTTGFKAVAKELSDALKACGLVQTGDSGQIDWDSAPEFTATNTAYGFEMFTLADSQAANLPVYIKIEYGRSGAAGSGGHQLWVTVGGGSDGAGNVTSIYIARSTALQGNSAYSAPETSYPTAVCVADGFVAVAFKIGSRTSDAAPSGGFIIARTPDSAGSPNADGLFVVFGPSSGTNTPAYCYRAAAGATISALMTSTCLIPFAQASSLVGADAQAFKHYASLPRIRPLGSILTVMTSELGGLTAFPCAPVGAATRTFLSLGPRSFGSTATGATVAQANLAILWE